ncbi:hypothetical protein [Streptomyces achromogenes]|uniref:hypothetical protein n=1 Tax=Streptomyces achromogenes TaxID=67255 RepID=UPI00368D956D
MTGQDPTATELDTGRPHRLALPYFVPDEVSDEDGRTTPPPGRRPPCPPAVT